MKKQILNLGKVLSKSDQKSITGGNFQCVLACYDDCLASSNGDRMVYANCLDVCIPGCGW